MTDACQFVPSLLYWNEAPKGDVIVIVPVATAQVGWIIVPVTVYDGHARGTTVGSSFPAPLP